MYVCLRIWDDTAAIPGSEQTINYHFYRCYDANSCTKSWIVIKTIIHVLKSWVHVSYCYYKYKANPDVNNTIIDPCTKKHGIYKYHSFTRKWMCTWLTKRATVASVPMMPSVPLSKWEEGCLALVITSKDNNSPGNEKLGDLKWMIHVLENC